MKKFILFALMLLTIESLYAIEFVNVEKGTVTITTGVSITIDKSFKISKYEITQDEFQTIMKYNDSEKKGKLLPKICTTIYEGILFCNELSRLEGLRPYYTLTNPIKKQGKVVSATILENNNNGYRLLTLNEWIFAARGGNLTKGYEYSGSDNIEDVAIVSNSDGPQEIGKKLPNELGIYDMTGNLAEIIYDTNLSKTNGFIIGGSYFDDKEWECGTYPYFSPAESALINARIIYIYDTENLEGGLRVGKYIEEMVK